MLPHLPGLNGLVAGEAVQVPPPHAFCGPKGEIRNVRHEPRLQVLVSSGNTVAQKAGLRYERKIQERLCNSFLSAYIPNISFSWQDDLGKRYCEMDGLINSKEKLVCVEIKYQHMAEAWWQLRKKYEPVLRAWHALHGRELVLIEICRSLDPATPFPETYTHIEELIDFVEYSKDGELGVFQWKL